MAQFLPVAQITKIKIHIAYLDSVVPIEIPSIAKYANVTTEKEESNRLHDEANKMSPKEEEVSLGARKQEYNQKSQSKIANNQPCQKPAKRTRRNKVNKLGESVVQPFVMQEPIVETSQSQEKECFDKEIFENEDALKENPTTNRDNVDAGVEIFYGSHSASKVSGDQMPILPELSIFDSTHGSNDVGFGDDDDDDDDDPIKKLASLISADEEVSASQSTQAENKDKSTEEEAERKSMIKKAMLTLSECFQIDLSIVYSTPDTKAKLEQAIQFLQSVPVRDDITLECKSFVEKLVEYLPTFWAQLSKIPEVKSKHAELVRRKQDLTAFSKVALVKREQFIEKCSSARKARDENLQKIQALEQQIANLQAELQSRQSQHVELERSFKEVNEERIQLVLKAEKATVDFKDIKALLKSVGNELHETLSAEASAKLQWKELQETFNNSLRKFVD